MSAQLSEQNDRSQDCPKILKASKVEGLRHKPVGQVRVACHCRQGEFSASTVGRVVLSKHCVRRVTYCSCARQATEAGRGLAGQHLCSKRYIYFRLLLGPARLLLSSSASMQTVRKFSGWDRATIMPCLWQPPACCTSCFTALPSRSCHMSDTC